MMRRESLGSAKLLLRYVSACLSPSPRANVTNARHGVNVERILAIAYWGVCDWMLTRRAPQTLS
jgi:hypothetical protein